MPSTRSIPRRGPARIRNGCCSAATGGNVKHCLAMAPRPLTAAGGAPSTRADSTRCERFSVVAGALALARLCSRGGCWSQEAHRKEEQSSQSKHRQLQCVMPTDCAATITTAHPIAGRGNRDESLHVRPKADDAFGSPFGLKNPSFQFSFRHERHGKFASYLWALCGAWISESSRYPPKASAY